MLKTKDLQTLAYGLFVTIAIGFLFIKGATILLPFIFACLLAIFMLPIYRKISKIIKYELLSIILCFLIILTPFILLALIFSYQLYDIVEGLPGIEQNLKKSVTRAIAYFNDAIPFVNLDPDKILKGDIESPVSGSMIALRTGIASTSSVLFGFAMTFLYSFFLLYYKDSIKNFLIFQFKKGKRSDVLSVFDKIKSTIQSYVGGMGIVIIILTILNSTGLYLIGIDYPLFWGALAGVLAIIPFIGTLIGGLLPFLYSISTSDYSWQPVAVGGYYFLVQQLEGNFITPKVVGDKVNINPLIAIMSLLFFGSFWGVSGVILALPLISIMRIVFSQIDDTKPLALLMSSNVADKSEMFESVS